MESFKIKKILVPIDFSELSVNALQTAIAISKRQLSAITLIHVIENSYLLFPPEAGIPVGGVILPDHTKEANNRLGTLAKEIRLKHDLVVNHTVLSGNPADEICRWALHKEVDMIVMGTHGASGLREFFLGSIAYRVVKNSACPVMTIPGTKEWINFKKILFPVRMIPNALDKYANIRPVIRKNNSTLIIAGIVKKSDPAGFIEMKSLIDSIRIQLEEDHITCSSEVHYCDHIAEQVLEISRIEKPDLIVITADFEHSLKAFFLGPYTQDIVNHAQFPVLSIRPSQPAMPDDLIISAPQFLRVDDFADSSISMKIVGET